MTHHEQQSALEALAGWREPVPPTQTGMKWLGNSVELKFPPRFLHDLNAVQPLLIQLAHGERLLWITAMDTITSRRAEGWLPGRIATAPAAEWCEALLHVKGLWKE